MPLCAKILAQRGVFMTLRYIDYFRPHLRQQRQATIDAGRIHLIDEFEVLDPQQLRPLALLSFLLLLLGLLFFGFLNLAAYFWWGHFPALHSSVGSIVFALLLNILGYLLILPIHEEIHALAFFFWGGRPYFGAHLPLALFCGAREQLFPRNYYLVIGLAPLLVLTCAGVLFTCLRPDLAWYTLLATSGNLSGAAGDLYTVMRLLRHSSAILVEDTDSGYRAWMLLSY
jgi:hypothetical protein